MMTSRFNYTYFDHIVKLTQDISIGNIAKDYFSFNGVFDGGGHTINFDLTTSYDESIAPFPYTEDATISRLNTTANITVDDAEYCFVGGIVGSSMGTLTINSCRSSIIVSQLDAIDCYFGGFVGNAYTSDITINNCLFDGKIEATGNAVSGFVGVNYLSRLHIMNSLMAGSLEYDTSNSGVFYSPDKTSEFYLSNCYCINDIQQAQGTQTSASGNELKALLGDGWTVSNGNVIPVTDDKNLATAIIYGIEDCYIYTDSVIDLLYEISSMTRKPLIPDTHYTVQIRNSNDEIIDQVIEKGSYTITFTGKDDYYGTRSLNFFVDSCPEELSIDASYKKGDPGYYYATIPSQEDTVSITLSDDQIKSFKVYDIRGFGNYKSQSQGALIITVPDGYSIKVTGNISSSWFFYSTLSIYYYDGNNYDSVLFELATGDEEYDMVELGTIYSPTNSIMIYFYSYIPLPENLDLTITMVRASDPYDITVLPSSNGKLETDLNSAVLNTIVNLTASPDEGYLLDSIIVTETDGNRLAVNGGHWYNNNATFSMHESAVTAQAKFIPVNSDEICVNMPYKSNRVSTDTVYLTDTKVKTFKLYDNGGKDGDYILYNDSYLILHAPDGYVFKLTGTLKTEITKTTIWDYLCIYDGNSNASQLLADTLYSTEECPIVDIGTVYSTGQDLMLYLHSDMYSVAEGIDFTVTLVSADEMTAVQTHKAAAESSDWYLPDGRKLMGSPTPGTLYLQPGRKVIVVP